MILYGKMFNSLKGEGGRVIRSQNRSLLYYEWENGGGDVPQSNDGEEDDNMSIKQLLK